MSITDITIVENDVKSFQVPMETEMAKAIKHFEGELIKIRSGRAHTSLVENVPVSLYGQEPAPLKNFAALAAVDARLITVQPWDPTIQLPLMSSDRRDELVKILGKKAEECKVTMRNTRKDFNNILRDSKKNKTISEDFFNRLSDTLQDVTTKSTDKVDQMAKKKESEITSI